MDEDTLLRDLELEPTNIDAYLVYADLLQTRGDPRGQLIAYHHALRLDPTNSAAQLGADELLNTHRETWLGPAAKTKVRARFEWFMGFPERVQLGGSSTAVLARMLAQLLDLDGFRLVQRLIIEVDEEVFDPGAFWDLLRTRGRPRALRELRIGAPGRARMPAELLEQFPRLRERPDLSWTKLRESIGEQRRLKTSFEQSKLPGLTLLDPSLGLEVDTHELVLGLRAELDKKRQLGVLVAMQRLFTPGSLDGLTVALLREWERKGAKGAQRWVLDVAAAIGGDQSAAYLASRLGSWSHQRAVRATEVLVGLGAPMGLNEIYQLSWHEASRSENAARVLGRMAKNRGVPVIAVLDRAVPQDPDRETRRRFLAIQERWLEDLMVNGHRLSRADFIHFVAAGPRHALASRLVWGVFRDHDQIASIGLDPKGMPFDSAGKPAPIPSDARVGLLHPMEMSSVERSAWLRRFAELGLRQPFLQLRRPMLQLTPRELEMRNLFRFEGRPADEPPQSYNNGRWTRWQSYNIEEEYTMYGFELRLERGKQRMSAVAVYEGEEIVRVFNRERQAFGDFDPLLVSELLFELERAATSPYEELQLVAELRERSGEKCFVCEGRLERGQLCLGLLRPQLSRRGYERLREAPRRMWVHWNCSEGVPELQLALARADVAADLRALREPLGDLPASKLGPTPQAPASPAKPGTATNAKIELTEAQALACAPDSRAATASKKAAKGRWRDEAYTSEHAWGIFAGSQGSYRTSVNLRTKQVRCTCPSRKRPCKHGVALMLLYARGELEEGVAPSWLRTR